MRIVTMLMLLPLAACSWSGGATPAHPAENCPGDQAPPPRQAIPAPPPEPQIAFSMAQSVTCRNGDDERLVYVEGSPDGACRLLYTRQETTRVIASSSHDSGYCQEALEKFTRNLLRAGYRCE